MKSGKNDRVRSSPLGGVMGLHRYRMQSVNFKYRIGNRGMRGIWHTVMMMNAIRGPLHAKVAAGASGVVTDSSGAVVPGAIVEMKNLATGIVETREANADGFYAFVDLQPGGYDMT